MTYVLIQKKVLYFKNYYQTHTEGTGVGGAGGEEKGEREGIFYRL